ncbi:MAG: response regulator [Xanthobacteraceae bacterium]|jgi:CheY-like chemotaxis protein
MAVILVIDDDQSVRTAIRALLEHRGIDVLVADSGAAGISHLDTSAVDLAVVDIFMPDMDGLEIIRTLKQRNPGLPVIAMSGFLARDSHRVAPDFLRMAGLLGAACCLRKPFQPHQLMAAIDACLGLPIGTPRHRAPLMSTAERIAEELQRAFPVLGCVAGPDAIRALGA